MLNLNAKKKLRHKNKIVLISYEIYGGIPRFYKIGEKIGFSIKGKLFLKYKILDTFESPEIKIKPLGLNFPGHFFDYLNSRPSKSNFPSDKKKKKFFLNNSILIK